MQTQRTSEKRVVIIGAGPAGLTAAYELTQFKVRPIVVESLDKVGGISRTEHANGFHFDMGGHRFFTKSRRIEEFWHEVLGDDLLRRRRLSRIYYDKKFFYYPLRPVNALVGLGFLQSVLVTLSYLRWQLFPYEQEDTFEQWVTNRFGRRLFLTFFKTYTEKIWGISCSELRAEWAVQRIKDLSLKTALINMLVKRNNAIRTLIEEFDYPRRGPGMLWTVVKDCVEGRGGTVRLNSEVVRIHREGNRIEGVTTSSDGCQQTVLGTHFISSMAVTDLIKRLEPPPPAPVLEAARRLKHRDFLTVCLIVNMEELFPDNWIYIHDPTVQVGRIQNFGNWSPDMVPDPSKTSLGLEYFCNEGDQLWNMSDGELVGLGKRELDKIGLADYADIEDGHVFRVPKAYPVYDSEYREHLDVLREYLEGLENLQTVGRNGLHRYNNQDHTMITAMLAVRNLMLGEDNNLWVADAEQEYLEEFRDETEAQLREATEVVRETLAEVFPKLEPVALGLSVGIVGGVLLFLATLFLVLKGGDVVGPRLGLLSQYFPGYDVTMRGSVWGLAYGFAVGFVLGWGGALVRNISVFLNTAVIQRRAELGNLRDILDYIY